MRETNVGTATVIGRLLGRRPWFQDVCDRYGITPQQALDLGTRRPGRRPDLPAGQTCPAVTRMTLEEIWASRPRDTQAAVEQFYRDMGTWAVLRQSVRNRRRSWAFLDRHLPWGSTRLWLLEFGCGIAPCATWLLERRRRHPAGVVLVDVPSEHLDFAMWRLTRRADELRANWEIIPSPTSLLPLPWEIATAVATETLEHVPDPLASVRWLAACLHSGGWFVEDFHPHRPGDAQAPWDLPSAQAARPAVYAFLADRFELVEGRHWDAPDGGGTRLWRKRDV